MLSQSTNKQFVGSLVNDLIVELEFRNYEVILMPPLNFLSIESQHKWLDKISKNRLFFKGGFIIPQGDPKRKQVFLDFIDNFKKPIVFFDAPPPFATQDLRENNLFISYDNSKGGEIAVEAMIKEFKRRGISSYKVLVIGCNIVVDRQNSFREYFKKFNDNIEIIVLNNGEFTRESGYRIFKQVLWDNGNNYKKYQGIFCTNDEMALGIIELINELNDFPREETVLIGYDATDEAISLINSNSSPFKNSVNQDSKKLAEICVENFINLRQKKYSNSKELLIEPRLYKSLEN